jgi:nucleosome assembly protein 1-like 1
MSEPERPLSPNSTSGGDPPPPDEHPEIENDDHEEEDSESAEDDDDNEEEEDSDDEEDFVASLPPPIRKKVDQLKKLNQEREAFMEKYLEERAALEKKYNELNKPLYDKRRDIINGAVEESQDDNVNDDNDNQAASDEQNNANNEQEGDVQGIPEFWTMAMNNIETIEELITERDSPCLLYLEDITCQDFDNGLGFTLHFHFKENPYFTNKVLTKRYDVPNLLIEDEPILKNVVGCDINWKDDMCLTFRTITKKQRNKKGVIRHVKRKEKTPSFFHFFIPPKLPEIQDMDEEEADAIEEAFDHDYDVAQQFRSYIIPKAVLWFTGEAMENALEGVFEGENSMLSAQMQQQLSGQGGTSSASGGSNPFPPPAEGTEEPECKQS